MKSKILINIEKSMKRFIGNRKNLNIGYKEI